MLSPDHDASPKRAPAFALKGRGLTVRRRGTTILHGVDMVAQSGELIGILGPSGSGKSTLLTTLSAFRPPTEGTLTFRGRDLVKDFEDLKRAIGFVPQDDVVPAQLKVERVLKYAAELRLPHFSEEAREGRVNGILHALELTERRKLRVSKLSGGQRKRVSIGVELICRPDVLFADEPTSGLDPALESSMMELLRRMADEGRVVLVTTHIMASLALLDRVCLLHQGRVAFFGPPAELKPWFEVDDFTEIYQRLSSKSSEEWHNRFAASDLHRTYLAAPLR